MDWKGNNDAHSDDKAVKKALFGVETRNRLVRRFKLFFRSGQCISVPYALLPLIILEVDKNLRLKAHGLEILVKGRGLHRLEEYLNDEKLIWIKEAPSNMDDAESYEVFIAAIEVDGDLVV